MNYVQDKIDEDIQELDRKYADGIAKVAKQ